MFDESFASAPGSEQQPLVPLIAILVSGDPAVLRARDILGIAKVKRILPFPSVFAEVIGIAGMRGVVVPVFDLAKLLQMPTAQGRTDWLVLANRESPIAFAFEKFEGQVEVSPAAIFSAETPSGADGPTLLARVGSSIRPVVEVPHLVEEIRKRAGLPGPARSNHS
jgi:purine-binding chemotaxis protein CheW